MIKYKFNIISLLLSFSLLVLPLSVQSKKISNKNKLLSLASVSSIVIDLKTGKKLLEKNAQLIMPIASITKLMTAMVILDAKLPLKEKIRFKKSDRSRINSYFSRIRLGSELSRGDVLRIALMSSENLAASALGGNYPGGVKAFIKMSI